MRAKVKKERGHKTLWNYIKILFLHTSYKPHQKPQEGPVQCDASSDGPSSLFSCCWGLYSVAWSARALDVLLQIKHVFIILGCLMGMLDDCVLLSDLTWPPLIGGGKRSLYIMITIGTNAIICPPWVCSYFTVDSTTMWLMHLEDTPKKIILGGHKYQCSRSFIVINVIITIINIVLS